MLELGVRVNVWVRVGVRETPCTKRLEGTKCLKAVRTEREVLFACMRCLSGGSYGDITGETRMYSRRLSSYSF